MMSRLTPASMSRWSAERPVVTVSIWIGTLVIGLLLIVTLLEDSLTTAFEFTGTPESQRGVELIEELRGRPLAPTKS